MGTMNWVSIHLSVVAALLLIFCSVSESATGKRNGKIGANANVHPSVIMETDSKVGSFSVVEANVHMYPYSRVGSRSVLRANVKLDVYVRVGDHTFIRSDTLLRTGSRVGDHVEIDENVKIDSKSQVWDHSHIRKFAIIGKNTVCEPHTSIGLKTGIGNDVRLKEYASVGRHAVIGSHVYVGRNVQIGPHTTVGSHSIVHDSVVVPGNLHIGQYTTVISSLDTNSLMRMLRGRKFSPKFIDAAKSLVKLSDSRFSSQMSLEIGYILNMGLALYQTDRTSHIFVPQVILLTYAYLARIHGHEKLDRLKRLDKWKEDDCKEPRRFDKIFNQDTISKFIFMLALYESQREASFDVIIVELFKGRRSVHATSEKCGGTIAMSCSNTKCLDGPQSPTGTTKWMTEADVYYN